jgi:long-chain fatty acid transport protein
MKRIGLVLIVVGLVLAAAASASAGGFAVSEQSASAGGIASAATARADDASAAWYNPAALADAGGWRIGFGILAAHPNLTAEAMDGSWQSSNESTWATPPHINASFADGDFAAGVAAGVPYGSGVTWPADWPGRFEIVRTKLEVFRASPFVAWRFGNWRVAGGLHVDRARMRVGRQLDFIDVEGDVAIDMDGTGWGVDAAVFYRASDRVDVGLSYKSRTGIDLSGGADFESPDAFSMKTADQNASARITIPDRIALGGRWQARDDLGVLADLEMTLWGVYDELVIDFANDATPDARQVNNWKTTVAVRTGAEWKFRPGWVGRAGVFFDPSPAQDDTLAPSSPDSSRTGVTLGASRALGDAWTVDVFAEHMQLLGRESRNENALEARYGGHAQLFGFGVRYQQ